VTLEHLALLHHLRLHLLTAQTYLLLLQEAQDQDQRLWRCIRWVAVYTGSSQEVSNAMNRREHMTNVQDCIVSAQLCIGNALEEVDRLAQIGLDAQGQETLIDVGKYLHQAVRKLANVVIPGAVIVKKPT
jgi:hypothetical protein